MAASMCLRRWRAARRPAWSSRRARKPSASSGEAIAAYARLKAATGPIAAAYFDQPTEQLDVLAVTGTNGKTSTAWWLAQALSNLPPAHAVPCGLIGTLGTGRPPDVEFMGLTTPDPVLLQRQFRRFVDDGLKACAIEASSVGIVERRLDGTRIRVAVFTNFTQDHLDYHGTMEAYWDAKAELFRWPGLRAAVVNVDDEKGEALAQSLQAGGLDLWTVSCQRPARLAAQDIGYDEQGLRFVVQEGGDRHALATRLIGQYNVSNLLGVIGAMRALGVPLADAVHGLRQPAAGARPHGTPAGSRQAAGRGGLCPHARRAGQGAAGAQAAGARSAAASSGACSAAAATATRPSAR